ncbi:MAG: IS1182 family transposase [Acidobacteriota bacterium]|nr:IS1182 family transposase [Acidobacteriota bacterium]
MDRRQIVLEQVDVEQMVAADHPARNIWILLERLNLTGFDGDVKAVEGHAGRNLWEPRLLIAIWLYAYSRGISSARQIERECAYEPGLRWLTGLKAVNHHTLSDFRVRHGQALQDLFTQVLAMLSMEKLIMLERVTVDGTKVRAAVSKKTFSRAGKIREHLKVARAHIETLQQEEAEQSQRGRAAAARRRAGQDRVERLEQAWAEVERLQSEKKWDRDKPCQASTTDADAQFMRMSDHGLAPAYNVQVAVDAEHKLIVDIDVSKQPSDAQHLLPALDRIKQTRNRYPAQVIADGDYTHRKAVVGTAERSVDFYGSWRGTGEQEMNNGIAAGYGPEAFRYDEQADRLICPEGKPLKLKQIQTSDDGLRTHIYAAARRDCSQCPARASCTPQNAMEKHGRAVSIRHEPAVMETYHAKMATEKGKAIYKQRAPVAEFPHAWMKDKLKWTRLRCRGLVRVRAEALWVALTYNLQRYFKLRHLQAA